ncbi:hypothetical protein LCGC14_2614830, partial [marine sediment metagenome]
MGAARLDRDLELMTTVPTDSRGGEHSFGAVRTALHRLILGLVLIRMVSRDFTQHQPTRKPYDDRHRHRDSRKEGEHNTAADDGTEYTQQDVALR